MPVVSPVSRESKTIPGLRPRRLRASEAMRSLVRETRLSRDQLIQPFFVVEGLKLRQPISSMPGVFHLSIDELLLEVEQSLQAGVRAVLLVGLPQGKDTEATGAWREDGVVQSATRAIKERFPELIVIADTCLCEYMSHGHCGVVAGGQVLNDPTLEILAKTAVSQARAGADIIAPSDMMDGRVAAIRAGLDQAGYQNTPILAYSAKFASSLYGPFREAAQSAPQFGDRKSYQMDPANGREALREIELDIAEGADMVMIKPALLYLDVIKEARALTNLPIAAYNVSGEYSMIKAAAANGWIDEKMVVMESLTSIVRAGADLIISYHAREAASWLA